MPADYERVIDGIAAKIAAGEYKPGDALPSIVRLAAEYATSQTTVKTALAILRDRGAIRGHQGKATYVAGPDDPSTEIITGQGHESPVCHDHGTQPDPPGSNGT